MKRLRLYVIAMIFGAIILGLPQVVIGRGLVKSGKQCEYFSDGKLKIENIYKKGLLVRSRNYYRNGRLMSEYKYKNGREHLRRTFYESGRLKSLWAEKSGITKYYHKSGSLRLVVDHNQDKPKYPSSYIYSDK